MVVSDRRNRQNHRRRFSRCEGSSGRLRDEVVAVQPVPLGVALREHRRRAGLTQQELAVRAGVSVRALRELEQDRVRHPHQRSVQQLMTTLGLLDLERPASAATVTQPGDPHGDDGPVWIGVLGPLAVRHGGVAVDPGTAKVRSLLGLLAIQPGDLVARDEIVDGLWGERPPATCLALVHTYVARLRRRLEGGHHGSDAAPAVVLDHGGYRLRADVDGLDVLRFTQLAGRAHDASVAGSHAAACDTFAQPLAVWRGPVLADLSLRLRQHPAAVGLAQRRIAAALAWADLATQIGRGEQVIELLRRLAGDEPLHEELHARLMLALTSCGQQAAALGLFADLRARLVEELGVEPGPRVHDVYLRILRQQVAPAVDATSAVAGAAGRRTGSGKDRVPPQQLPLDLPGFTGREEQLAQLDGLLPGAGQPATTVIIASVSGTAGVGKTALAVHWAHRVRSRFRDGSLFANLRGHDPTGAPVPPAEVLDGFLRALGVRPALIPPSVEERAGLFRTLLNNRRMLIVLDNAGMSEQVRWLLPGAVGCLVVITSRSELSGLVVRSGAHRVPVGLLSESDALALLRQVIGPDRLAAEPAAAVELTRQCAYLPLALRLAAERAGRHPHLTLADLTRELADEYDRLDLLAAEDDETTAVRAVFSWSYRALTPLAARMFRRLGLHPGPEISFAAVAVLNDATRQQTRRVLETLTSVHLVQEIARDRYHLHDPLDLPAVAEKPTGFAGTKAALEWCERERANLVAATRCAAQAGLVDIAWKLPFTLWSYFTVRKRWNDWIQSHQVGLAAVRDGRDRYGEACLLTSIANAYRDIRRFDAAFAHFQQAISLSREIGDRWLEAAALILLDIAQRDLRQFDTAIDCCQDALAIFAVVDDPWGKAWAFYNIGETYRDLGHYAQAIDYSGQALAWFGQINDPWGTGWSLSSIAQTLRHLHRLDEATDYCKKALSAAREVGNRQGEALALYTLGKIQHDAGHTASGRRSWRQALAIFEELGAPQAAEVRTRLR